MEKEKDELLAAFENPDIAEPVKEEVEVKSEPVAPVEAEVKPEPVEAEVKPVEAKPEVKPAEVKPEVKAAKVEVKETKKDGKDPSLKKNITFIFVLCALIALFIIFLPQIMDLLGAGTY